MREKGFTLIELLAVIVILAIIALIAVPIILNIIEDSKNSSNKRSIELYAKAIENAVGNYQLKNPQDKDITLEKVQKYIEYKGNKVECSTTKINKDGTIYLSGCKVDGKEVEYTYGKEIKIPIGRAVTESNKTLAGNIPTGDFDLGDEYIINVDGKHEYHFYVLSTEGDKVNLIMSNNICSDGTLATAEKKCLVFWLSSEDYELSLGIGEYGVVGNNNKGPITVMNYLYETTSNWNNISNIQMSYSDEGSTDDSGYKEMTTEGGITRIIMKDGTVTASYENLKARLPKYSEILGTGCTSDDGSCPAWMANGIKEYACPSCYYPEGTKEDIEDIFGYWSLSSDEASSLSEASSARMVRTSGRSWQEDISGAYSADGMHFTGYQYLYGVRPVIEILKSDLS